MRSGRNAARPRSKNSRWRSNTERVTRSKVRWRCAIASTNSCSVSAITRAATSLRPTLSPGFVDTNVGVGAKYRVLALDAPFIPFAMAQVTTALGGPLGYGDVHWNVGARLGGGVDYFVMRDLAVGVEIGSEFSVLAVPLLAPEWTTEVLLGVTWRL